MQQAAVGSRFAFTSCLALSHQPRVDGTSSRGCKVVMHVGRGNTLKIKDQLQMLLPIVVFILFEINLIAGICFLSSGLCSMLIE